MVRRRALAWKCARVTKSLRILINALTINQWIKN
jgi:hypothetical protein